MKEPKKKKQFREFLAEHKLKKTSQRELVWEVLLQSEGHPSVEEIRDRLLERGHRIGLSTIYRTLKILLDSGFIRQSKLGGMTQYEPLFNQPNHLHFICNRCGSNVEFPSRKIENLIKRATGEHGFLERYSRYAIFGFCRACAKKEAQAAGLSQKKRGERIFLRDALELTLTIERRGYSFYTNASRKTKDARGKLMFQQLAAGESDHLKKLQGAYRRLIEENQWLKREPARLPVSRRIAEQIFPEKDLLKVEVKDHTTDLEALNIAIDLERKSGNFFSQFAEQIQDAGGREIFIRFAKDEESHLEGLLAEYKKLGGGQWFDSQQRNTP